MVARNRNANRGRRRAFYPHAGYRRGVLRSEIKIGMTCLNLWPVGGCDNLTGLIGRRHCP
jgi:hypothetical protein